MAKQLNVQDSIISAKDDAYIYNLAFNKANGVFKFESMMTHEILSANQIRIKDGVAIIQGRIFIIYPGDSETVRIDNGSQGLKRHDIIVLEFSTQTGKEVLQLKVVKGQSSSSPNDPNLVKLDTLKNGSTYQMPLYRVKLDGVNVQSVEDMREYVPGLNEMAQVVANIPNQLNTFKEQLLPQIITNKYISSSSFSSVSKRSWDIDGEYKFRAWVSHSSMTNKDVFLQGTTIVNNASVGIFESAANGFYVYATERPSNTVVISQAVYLKGD